MSARRAFEAFCPKYGPHGMNIREDKPGQSSVAPEVTGEENHLIFGVLSYPEIFGEVTPEILKGKEEFL